ncbi:MAG: hypothetical protein AAGF15_03600 [Pseudomonadota bacterium]
MAITLGGSLGAVAEDIPAQTSIPMSGTALDAFHPFIGHCWEGELPKNGGTDVHCFQWVYDQKFVEDRHEVRGAGPLYEGRTLYMQEPETGEITYLYWASAGGASRGKVVAKPDGLYFPAESYTNEAGESRVFRSKWLEAEGASFISIMQEQTAEGWKDLWQVTYSDIGLAPEPERLAPRRYDENGNIEEAKPD